LDWLKKLPDLIKNNCIILDIGSTKRAIVSAMEILPANFAAIGCHAICGKERLSIENAERSLFQQAPFLLTPLSRTTDNARKAALEICQIVEAKPVWVTAESHDHFLAITSHLPYLLSSILTTITQEEAASFIGPGFRSSARLAATPSSMMLGVMQTNRDEILIALSKFQDQLAVFKNALQQDDAVKLKELLDFSRKQYDSLIQQS
jgi:prephenate dehydrogenase